VTVIFIYPTFELKICLFHKFYNFRTEIFRGIFFSTLALCFLVDVRLLDLHVGSSLENY